MVHIYLFEPSVGPVSVGSSVPKTGILNLTGSLPYISVLPLPTSTYSYTVTGLYNPRAKKFSPSEPEAKKNGDLLKY